MTKAPRNAEYTKEYNRKLMLRLLRKEALSRSELARRMGLTRAATSLIAEDLMCAGCIMEAVTQRSHTGRNPVPLELVGDCAWAVGIYLNRDGCRVALVNMQGEVAAQQQLQDLVPQCVDRLAESIRQMLRDTGISMEKVVGIGISAPGPLDGKRGTILMPPGFDAWHHTDIAGLVRQYFSVPVYLANDANAMAQYCLGKPETLGSENYLLLMVDRGIGSGLVIHQKNLKGAGSFTSELGHTSIVLDGRPCPCGNRGCLEAYASIPNLLRETEFTSWQQVMDSNSPHAMDLRRQEISYLAAGIINLANLVSIDRVLLAGDLCYRAQELAPELETAVNRRLLLRNVLPIRVGPCCTGENIPVQSAAELAFEEFLRI